MKIRNSFVSNSSSSSFCIIGTDGYDAIRALAKAEGKDYWGIEPVEVVKGGCDHKHSSKFCPECGRPAKVKEVSEGCDPKNYLSYGSDGGEFVVFFGNDEPRWVGVDAKMILEKMNLPQAREYFAKFVFEKFKITISPKLVDLHYGEVSS